VGVAPASGSGSAQTFTFEFSNPSGIVNVLINHVADPRFACDLAYSVTSATLNLVDDSGDTGGPYAGSLPLGSSSTIRNSNCSVNLVSAVGNGAALALTLNIAFSPRSGNHLIYLAAGDQSQGNTVWQPFGVWQVPFTPAGTISVTGVNPARGAAPPGTSQQFTFTFADTQGAADIGVVDVLFVSPARFQAGPFANSCYVVFVPSVSTIFLIDDAGDSGGPFAGSTVLPSSGTVSNSQCSIAGTGSSGNPLALTLNITFKAAFSGNWAVYSTARDKVGGNNTDWQPVGTWTVGGSQSGGGGSPTPPTITALSPSSATPGGAAFTLTVTGIGFDASTVVQWNGTNLATTFVGAIQVTAAVPANLIANVGTAIITVVTGGVASAAASFTVSAPPPPTPPSVGVPSPAMGSGNSSSFTFTFTDPRGYQDLDVVNILVNNVLDGRHACYLAYSVPSSVLYLVDDAGDGGGPFAGSVALGSTAPISNSQCSVVLTSAVGSGNTFTLTLNVTFTAAAATGFSALRPEALTAGFGGNRILYSAARDKAANNSGWQALGVWQVPFTPAGTIAVTSLTSARGAAPGGTPGSFVLVVTDNKGAADIGVVNLLVNSSIDGRQGCYLAYSGASNSLLLIDDPGDVAGPYAGTLALNGQGSIQNGHCLLTGTGTSVQTSGNTLTLTLNLTFKAAFAGNQILYAAGRDSQDLNNTDWQAMGTWTVQ